MKTETPVQAPKEDINVTVVFLMEAPVRRMGYLATVQTINLITPGVLHIVQIHAEDYLKMDLAVQVEFGLATFPPILTTRTVLSQKMVVLAQIFQDILIVKGKDLVVVEVIHLQTIPFVMQK